MYIVVESSDIFEPSREGLKIKQKNLWKTLQRHQIENLKQAFPYSKNEYLKRVYKIKFKGDAEKLKNDLMINHKDNIKKVIRLPKTENIALYDPSDWMWQAHKDDWLWHLTKIKADEAWEITHGDENVKIAILDTWFDLDHPDLENEIEPNYDPYDNASWTYSCAWNKSYNTTNCKKHHGTAVASFVAAHTDGGGQLASIGFNCKMIAYKAWDGDYLEKAQHASLNMNADIITSSAGGWRCSKNLNDIERIAVQEILNNGTIIVMPAGNGITKNADGTIENNTRCRPSGQTYDRPWFPLSPLYDERVIIVSSTDENDKHTYINKDRDTIIHSYYPEVDICAPGYCVMGAQPLRKDTCKAVTCADVCCKDNSWPYYGCGIGTSFATPIVAGACGLMKSVNSDLRPENAQEILKLTADPIQDWHLYSGMLGAGRINAYCAVYQTSPLDLSGPLSGEYKKYYINMNNTIC